MNQNKHTNFTPKIQFTAEHGHLFVAFFCIRDWLYGSLPSCKAVALYPK